MTSDLLCQRSLRRREMGRAEAAKLVRSLVAEMEEVVGLRRA